MNTHLISSHTIPVYESFKQFLAMNKVEYAPFAAILLRVKMLPDPDQTTVLESVWSTIILEVVNPPNLPSTVYTVVDVMDQSEEIMKHTRIFTDLLTYNVLTAI